MVVACIPGVLYGKVKSLERCGAQVHRGIKKKKCVCLCVCVSECQVCVAGGREGGRQSVCACIKIGDFLVRVAGLGISLGSD